MIEAAGDFNSMPSLLFSQSTADSNFAQQTAITFIVWLHFGFIWNNGMVTDWQFYRVFVFISK